MLPIKMFRTMRIHPYCKTPDYKYKNQGGSFQFYDSIAAPDGLVPPEKNLLTFHPPRWKEFSAPHLAPQPGNSNAEYQITIYSQNSGK